MKRYVLLIENIFDQESIQISFAVYKKLGTKVATLSKMEACLVRFLPDLLDTTKDSCPCLLTASLVERRRRTSGKMRGYVIYANDARGSRFFRTNERFPRSSI